MVETASKTPAKSPSERPPAQAHQLAVQDSLKRLRKAPEKEPGIIESVQKLVKEGVKSTIKVLRHASTWEKALIVVGGIAAVAYVLKKSFDVMMYIGRFTKEKMKETAAKTMKGVMIAALGASMGGIVYTAIKGKLNMAEVAKAFAIGGPIGVAKMLVKKSEDGLLSLGADTVTNLKKMAGLSITGAAAEGIDKLDKMVDLDAKKQWLVESLKAKGIDPPDVIENMTTKKMTNYLKENNVNVGDMMKLGGASYLIYKYLGWKGLAINGGIYLMLLKDAKGKPYAEKALKKYRKEIGGVRDSFVEKLKKTSPGLASAVDTMLPNVKEAGFVDGMIDIAAIDPVKTIAIANAAWMMRGVIFMFGKTMLKVGTKTLERAVVSAALMIGNVWARKELIDKIVDSIYPDGENDKEREKVRKALYLMAKVPKDAKTTIGKRLLVDNEAQLIETFGGGIGRLEIRKKFKSLIKNGDAGIGWADGGNTLWLILETSPPVVLAGQAKASVMSTINQLQSEENNGVLYPVIIGGTTTLVFSSATFGAAKAYKDLWDSSTGLKRGWRMTTSIFVPFSKSNRYLWKRAGIKPIEPLINMYRNHKLKSFKKSFSMISESINRLKNGDKTGEIVEGITKLVNELDEMKTAKELKEGLKGSSRVWSYVDKIKEAKESLQGIKTQLEAASGAVTGESLTNIRNLKNAVGTHFDDAGKILDKGVIKVMKKMFGRVANSELAGAAKGKVIQGASMAKESFQAFQEARKVLPAAKEILKRGSKLNLRKLGQLKRIVQTGGEGSKAVTTALKELGYADEAAEEIIKVLANSSKGATEAVEIIAKSGLGSDVLKLSTGAKMFAKGARFAPYLGPIASFGEGIIRGAYSIHLANQVKNNPEMRNALYEGGALHLAWGGGAAAAETLAIARYSKLGVDAARLGFIGKTAVVGAAVSTTIISLGAMATQHMIEGGLDAATEVAMKKNDYIKLAKEKGQGEARKTLDYRLLMKAYQDAEKNNDKEKMKLYKDELENLSQKMGMKELIHMWFTTGQDTGAGEAYNSAFTTNTVKGFEEERNATRLKIVEALIYLDSGDKGVPYNQYRMAYVRAETGDFGVNSYQDAEILLAKSRHFADVMKTRNQKLSFKKSANETKTIDLNDEKYNPDNIGTKEIYEVMHGIADAENNILIDTIGKERFVLLQSMDVNYLNHVANLISFKEYNDHMNTTADYEEKLAKNPEVSLAPAERKLLDLKVGIILYLERHGTPFITDQTIDVQDLGEIENIKKVFLSNSSAAKLDKKALKESMKDFLPKTAGTAALYSLAKFFGYRGMPKIERLKNFFPESKAAIYGLYWNGKNWYINNEYGIDENRGPNIDAAMADTKGYIYNDDGIINEFINDADEVFGSHYDDITDIDLRTKARDDVRKRAEQAKKLGHIMKQAFENFKKP